MESLANINRRITALISMILEQAYAFFCQINVLLRNDFRWAFYSMSQTLKFPSLPMDQCVG